MRGTFSGCHRFDYDLGAWDTASVTEMYYMFKGATRFNQDLRHWDVSAVRNARAMFCEANAFQAVYYPPFNYNYVEEDFLAIE